MKKISIFLVFLFAPLFIFYSASAQSVCVNCKKLKQALFPDSYCTALCALSILHPNWTFEPLFITKLSSLQGENYDFSYVLEKECAEKERSLISGEEKYLAYRHEQTYRSDTGSYRASREAVAYFLDPRNHLSVKSIFQFLLLSENVGTDARCVSKALAGSALEGKVSPDFLISLGKQMGVDPLFCAVRLFQEQGSKGSVLLSGTAGDCLALWQDGGVWEEEGKLVKSPNSTFDRQSLLALNGVYNPFHVSASGDGAFWVYYNGATHAKKMGWDSLEKGLVGGMQKLASEYITRYQNTLYLQKWNVDIRSENDSGQSRNFWAQYMQNVGAAKTEADRLASVYEQMGLTELPLHFLIPVYEGLPTEPCMDPAQGNVDLFASAPIDFSEHLYQEEGADLSVWKESDSLPMKEAREKEEKNPFLLAVLLCVFLCFLFGIFCFAIFLVRWFYPILLPKRFDDREK